MTDIGKEMTDQVSQALFWLGIFLSAPRTKPFFDNGAAVQTGLIMTEMVTAHGFFLKISKNIFSIRDLLPVRSDPPAAAPYT